MGIYPRKMKTSIGQMFIANLLVIGKNLVGKCLITYISTKQSVIDMNNGIVLRNKREKYDNMQNRCSSKLLF